MEGIEEVARHVLKPCFHEEREGVGIAISQSLRHYGVLTRDGIINVWLGVRGCSIKWI